MFVLIGFGVVITSVIVGYLWEHGNLSLLYQPAEFVIIAGGALGGMLIASSPKIARTILHGLKSIMTSKPYGRQDYVVLLMMANDLFLKIRREGLRSLEAELDKPLESRFFGRYPNFVQNRHALFLLTDVFRTISTTKLEGHHLEALLDSDIEAYHEELMVSSKSIAHMADSLPGLGIVAAVLGVVITMQKINEPPDVLGHSIGAALVGTFLGVLLAYGFVGPLALKLENIANEEREYLNVLKAIIVSFVNGVHPQIAVEFGRMLIPDSARPSFMEIDEMIRQAKVIAGKQESAKGKA